MQKWKYFGEDNVSSGRMAPWWTDDMISGNHRSSAVLYQDHWIENEIGKPLRKIHSTENEIHLYSTFEVDIQLLEATISNFWTV